MADFCKQCSEYMFEKDYGDLAGLSSTENDEQGHVVLVICEGCGPTAVDSKGECKSKDCLVGGHNALRSGAV